MVRHHLYEIDLEGKTAFCTVCGHTKIYVVPSRTRTVPKVYCVKRAEEMRENEQERHEQKRKERQFQPGWRQRHTLSDIDAENMTAVCAICGPTDIWKDRRKGNIRFDCGTKQREYFRMYRRGHYVSQSKNPLAHTLSDIDEENMTAVCSQCGLVIIEIRYGKRKITRRCSRTKLTPKEYEK